MCAVKFNADVDPKLVSLIENRSKKSSFPAAPLYSIVDSDQPAQTLWGRVTTWCREHKAEITTVAAVVAIIAGMVLGLGNYSHTLKSIGFAAIGAGVVLSALALKTSAAKDGAERYKEGRRYDIKEKPLLWNDEGGRYILMQDDEENILWTFPISGCDPRPDPEGQHSCWEEDSSWEERGELPPVYVVVASKPKINCLEN